MFTLPESLQSLQKDAPAPQKLLLEMLSRNSKDALQPLLSEATRTLKSVGAIADGLVLRNFQRIIDHSKAVQQQLLEDGHTETDEKLERAHEAVAQLQEQFIDKFDRIQDSQACLARVYDTKRLGTAYLKLLKTNSALQTLLKETNPDLEQTSELYSKCMQLIRTHKFEGISGYETLREAVELAKKTIQAKLDQRLATSVIGLNFIECKASLTAFDNLGLLQAKLQETANRIIKESFMIMKEVFTNSQMVYRVTEACEDLEAFQSVLSRMFSQICRNIQGVWVLEVSLLERKNSIKDKDFEQIFRLFYKKLSEVILQTFKKLIENHKDCNTAFHLIYLNVGHVIKQFEQLVNKVHLFIINHHNGNHKYHITLEDLQAILSLDLRELMIKESSSLLDVQISELKLPELLLTDATELQSAFLSPTTAATLEGLHKLWLYQAQNSRPEVHFVLLSMDTWLQELIESLSSLEELQDTDISEMIDITDKDASCSQVAGLYNFIRSFKVLEFLVGATNTSSKLNYFIKITEAELILTSHKLKQKLASIGQMFTRKLLSYLNSTLTTASDEGKVATEVRRTLNDTFSDERALKVLELVVRVKTNPGSSLNRQESLAIKALAVGLSNLHSNTKTFLPEAVAQQPNSANPSNLCSEIDSLFKELKATASHEKLETGSVTDSRVVIRQLLDLLQTETQ